MEIDITDFVNEADFFEFSASQAERGADAGPETWCNAVKEAADKPLLTTQAQLDAFRSWAKASGGWSKNEIALWSSAKCNALFIRLVSGDMRELESLCMDDCGEIDWSKAQELSEQGTIGGSLYRGDMEGSDGFGRIFYRLDC